MNKAILSLTTRKGACDSSNGSPERSHPVVVLAGDPNDDDDRRLDQAKRIDAILTG
jgi:hypothetical protein